MSQEQISEFSYREDYRMTDKGSVYRNEISLNLGHKIVMGSIVIFLTPNPFALSDYKESQELSKPKIIQTDYTSWHQDMRDNQIIREALPVSEQLTPYQKLQTYVSKFYTLPTNWDGTGSLAPSEQVCENASRFIAAMQQSGVSCPSEDEVMPSAFATIVFDIMMPRGLVSIEVGEKGIGFFTDYVDGINQESSGTPSDFNSIPSSLLSHLTLSV